MKSIESSIKTNENHKDTYLSIDLDFWQESPFPDEFIRQTVALAATLPHVIVREHHKMLSHINDHPRLTSILNVDWHSDVSNVGPHPNINELKCGTWASFIKPRKSFIWYYPSLLCVQSRSNAFHRSGYCNNIERSNPFLVKNPYRICGLKDVSKRWGIPGQSELARVGAIGFCLSDPWFWGKNKAKEILVKFRELTKQYQLKQTIASQKYLQRI